MCRRPKALSLQDCNIHLLQLCGIFFVIMIYIYIYTVYFLTDLKLFTCYQKLTPFYKKRFTNTLHPQTTLNKKYFINKSPKSLPTVMRSYLIPTVTPTVTITSLLLLVTIVMVSKIEYITLFK